MNVATFTGDDGNLDYKYVSRIMWPASAAIIFVITLASWYFWKQAEVKAAQTFPDTTFDVITRVSGAGMGVSSGERRRKEKGVPDFSTTEPRKRWSKLNGHSRLPTPSALEAQPDD